MTNSKKTAWLIPVLTNFAMLVAFFLAPQFPNLEPLLKPYAKYSLSILLLINALHINYRSLSNVLLRKPLLLGYGILVKNILLPLSAFGVCYLLWPTALTAAVLLTGMSSGFSAVSFAILLGLKPETNLLLTLGTSFVVPFTLPLLLYILANANVEVEVIAMMLQTAFMIFAPLLLERILFWSLPKFHAWLTKYSHKVLAINLSMAAFIIMLSGQEVLRRQAFEFYYILAFTIFSALIIYIISLLFSYKASLETQLVILTGNLVSNSGMASVLALDYLDNRTLAITIIYGVIWNFNIPILRTWPPLRKLITKQ